MSSEDEYFTVVDIKHYAYCPMIVYFTRVLHLHERITESMLYGAESHDEAVVSSIAVKLGAQRIIRGVELTSDRLKLRGRLDYLIVTRFGELVPVEFKWSETEDGSIKRDHKLQLASYALMVEEAYGRPVKRIVVYYERSSKIVVVPLDADVKKQVKRILDSMERITLSEDPPKHKPRPTRCLNCGFKAYCKPEIGDRNGESDS
jgi:CRISPR-associated exonuclease Cas4